MGRGGGTPRSKRTALSLAGTVASVRDWTFAHRPRWLASHLFVGSLLVLFVWAGFWQLSQLDERRARNDAILDRSTMQPVTVDSTLAGSLAIGALDPQGLDYVAADAVGRFVDGEAIRVANRSQNGLGGDWVVGLFEAKDGQRILVNRGFANRDARAVAAPEGEVTISGWLRVSQTKDGFFGATDTGDGARAPRLDVEAISARLGESELVSMWFQLQGGPSNEPPDPVPLPPIGEGSHFSYALQWFTFASLGAVVYGLVLGRKATNQTRKSSEFD